MHLLKFKRCQLRKELFTPWCAIVDGAEASCFLRFALSPFGPYATTFAPSHNNTINATQVNVVVIFHTILCQFTQQFLVVFSMDWRQLSFIGQIKCRNFFVHTGVSEALYMFHSRKIMGNKKFNKKVLLIKKKKFTTQPRTVAKVIRPMTSWTITYRYCTCHFDHLDYDDKL